MITTMPKDVLTQIQQLLASDLNATNQIITGQLTSDVPIIQTIAEYIVQSGGKRPRPLLVLLSANHFEYDGNEHHELAAIIEFVHTATLLHDDVIDASELRRGRQTANQIWGNPVSVLVGDFLYSRAFQLLTQRGRVPIMQVLAQTTNAIAEGEVSQLMYRHDPDIDEATYLDIIRRKTACLFGAATQIGAMLGNSTSTQQQAMADYGLHLGIAFQIVDDLLDYMADKSETGKNIGDDLVEGRTTLPLIYALQHSSEQHTQAIRNGIQKGSLDELNNILNAIDATNAKAYALSIAEQHAIKARDALKHLSDSVYKQTMEQLIEFVLQRRG